MVGSREDRGAIGNRKLLPSPDAHVQIEVLKLFLHGRAVEPGLLCGWDPMTPKRVQDVMVLRVVTSELQDQLCAYTEACHARVVNWTAKHVAAIRTRERRASFVKHPWDPRVPLEFGVERMRLHQRQVLRACDSRHT
jgi:hypothetical protein